MIFFLSSPQRYYVITIPGDLLRTRVITLFFNSPKSNSNLYELYFYLYRSLKKISSSFLATLKQTPLTHIGSATLSRTWLKLREHCGSMHLTISIIYWAQRGLAFSSRKYGRYASKAKYFSSPELLLPFQIRFSTCWSAWRFALLLRAKV